MDTTRRVLLCWCLLASSLTEIVVALSIDLPTSYTQVPENIPIGTTLVNFTVTGTSVSVALIDDQTRQLVNLNHTGKNYSALLGSSLDREVASSHTLKFKANDLNGNTRTATFQLYVTDVNDNAPTFIDIPYFLTLNETHNGSNTNHTFNISATDPDRGSNGTVRYSMRPNTQSPQRGAEYNKTFTINGTTGLVTQNTTVDYEKNSYYQFTVFAKDLGTPPLTSTTNLIIQIKDVQDQPPFYTGIPYRAYINENVVKGSAVINVNAQDGDSGVSNKVNYTIEPGQCDSLFEIDAVGNINTSNEIDRDTGPIQNVSGVCTLVVLAKEIEGEYTQYGNTSTTTTVVVVINDLDDNQPTFDSSEYNASVQENAPNDIPITIPGNIIAYDNDTGKNAEFTLSMTDANGTNCTDFEPWPKTIMGEQTVLIKVRNNSILDYEARHNITLHLIATETLNNASDKTCTIFLALINVNDNSPKFPNTTYRLDIEENVNDTTSIVNITATDRDSNKNLTYSLSGAGTSFYVDNTTGSIHTSCQDCNKTFDREKRNVYFLTYVVTDPGGRSDSVPLEVHLLDLNDNAPVFDRNYSASIKENDDQYENTSIVRLQARDNDLEETDNSLISYTISNITQTVNVFIVNETTGELFMNQTVDYECLNGSQIIITVTATDHGQPPLSSAATITVDIQDENDNTPEFIESDFRGFIAEDQTSNETHHAVVGTVNATDKDCTQPNNEFNYYISKGADEKFAINSTSGEVFVQMNAVLDREAKSNYNLTIMIIDRGASPRSATSQMEVTVSDVNDEKPRFSQKVFERDVNENSNKSYSVMNCSATDSDMDSDLFYNITSVEATDENGKPVEVDKIKDYFSINAMTGLVFVNGVVDRETAKMVTLYVMVIDKNASDRTSPQINTATVSITILDVNDNSPVFEDNNTVLNVSENSLIPTILTTVSATDRDENRTISYRITKVYKNDPSNETFQINEKTGVLSKTGAIDREVDDVIIVTIQATDSGVPPLSSYTNVTVNVLDFNDNTPEFNATTYNNTCLVPENVTANTTIFTVFATDRDTGPNANVTYQIDSGDGGNFTIDPINGTIMVKNSLDRETFQQYVLYITAKDNPLKDTEQKSSSTRVTVIVTDVNDNPPMFDQVSYFAFKPENMDLDQTIITVRATDRDRAGTSNSNVSYSLDSCNCSQPLFKIDPSTGDITVNMSLKEKVDVYELTVVAFDAGSPRLNGSATVVIEVDDVNNHAPFIDNIPVDGLITVNECIRPGTVIYNFTYTDADRGRNSEAHFNISVLDPKSRDLISKTFNITEDGVLRTQTKLNANFHSSYKFQVQASDGGDTVLKSEKASITVDILDINDNPPYFNQTLVTFSVMENENLTDIGKVKAYDNDTVANNCYNITEATHSKNLFNVNESTGWLTNIRILDYETVDSYNLTVKVHDCSSTTNVHKDCDNITQTTSTNDILLVQILVKDTNDNPPVFKTREMFTGMRRNTEINTPLKVNLKSDNYVTDKDSPPNGINAWEFYNNGRITASPGLSVEPDSGQDVCEDGLKYVFCISKNGSILNKKYFKEDVSGYYIVPVKVNDTAGDDTANITVYLIGDSQILVMAILEPKESVSQRKDSLLKAFSDVIGYTLVYDKLEDHKTSTGQIISDQSDLHFHVVDPVTSKVLSGSEARRLLDTFSSKLTYTMREYHVSSVEQSIQLMSTADESSKTTYIMVAIIVVLVVSNFIFVYVFLSVRKRYKRKLLAATITTKDKGIEMQSTSMAVPGSNTYMSRSNPLLNADIHEHQPAEYDELSLKSTNSIDLYDVDLSPAEHSEYDRIEEKEMTMDMYTEDVYTPSLDGESPLEAALRLHERSKSTENIIEDVDDIHVPVPIGMANYAFEDTLECSDI